MKNPKLIKVPHEQSNETENGILIKVNDSLFVLVEEEEKKGSGRAPFDIFDYGDHVRIKTSKTIQDKDFPRIPYEGWDGYIWNVISEPYYLHNSVSYQISWTEETVEKFPEVFKIYCDGNNFDFDEIIVPEDDLELLSDEFRIGDPVIVKHKAFCQDMAYPSINLERWKGIVNQKLTIAGHACVTIRWSLKTIMGIETSIIDWCEDQGLDINDMPIREKDLKVRSLEEKWQDQD